MLCSVHVNVCIEETGLWFFLWPAVNPLTEVLEKEGCYATPHSILTAALLLNGWFMVYWDQRGPVWSQIWLLQNADQTIAARAAHLAPSRQEFPHFTGPFCPDALGSSLVWIRVLHQCEWFVFRFWVAKMCIFTGFWEESVFVVFVCTKRRPS